MKVSIITFHRALNYGAFLQAYALQEFLRKQNVEVEFIDFKPYNDFVGKFWKKIPIFGNLLRYYRKKRHDTKLSNFYNGKQLGDYLNLSKEYQNTEDLKNSPPISDLYLCGSDQIWNPDYIYSNDLFDAIDAYFLAFGQNTIKRVAYAASIGHYNLKEEYLNQITPLLSNFHWVGVREKSSQELLLRSGIRSDWVCDPTLLHEQHFYRDFLMNNERQPKQAFLYLIRSELPNSIKCELSELGYDIKTVKLKNDLHLPSIFKWLDLIANSGFVITDSYHCVVFCLLFKTPFIVAAAHKKHSGINNRLTSLLGDLGLENRIIFTSMEDYKLTINNFLGADGIDWNKVDFKIESHRNISKDFLQNNCINIHNSQDCLNKC